MTINKLTLLWGRRPERDALNNKYYSASSRDTHFFDYFAWLPRKMVRIGIIEFALSDPHFCILSRDCFNLSRKYFSLWVIKTSLDRNASAVLERKCYFHASLVI